MNLSDLQLNKLKLGIKNGTEVTFYQIGYYDDETNFLHKLLLTDRQVLRLRKAFANKSSANIS